MTAPVPFKRIIAGLALVSIAIAAAAGVLIWQARQHAIEQAFVRTEGLAYALKQHAARTIDATALAVGVLVKQLRDERLDPVSGHELIAELLNDAPHVRNILVADETGTVIHDGLALPPRRFDLADRAYFAFHRESPSSDVFVSPPLQNPLTGLWTLSVSRRIDKRDGSFGGVVTAALKLDYLQSFYAQVVPGAQGSVVLAHANGQLILREPAVEPGRDLNGAELYRPLSRHKGSGSYRSGGTIDGVPRLVSYHRLIDYPLVTIVSAATDEALTEWRREAWQTAGAAAALLLVIGGLGALVVRSLRQREDALGRVDREKAIVDTMLATLPDGVQLLDADLKLVGWNDNLFRVMDLDKGQILGTPDPGKAFRYALAERGEYGPGDLDELVASRETIARTQAPVRYRRQLVTGKWMECRGTPIPGQGYLAVYRDITEEIAREAELRDTNVVLAQQTAQLVRAAEELGDARRLADEARTQAEDASQTKSAFLANMSHELRTPLNAVLGFSEIIAGQHFGRDALDRYSDYAGDIQRSGQHLLGLINNVLDLSKVEAGRMELYEEALDLADCLEDALLMVEAAAQEKSIPILYGRPSEPLRLLADKQKLRQCFINVLSNAVKFTPAGGRVSVAVRSVGSEVAVTVADTGIGISPLDQAKVFEPFGRVQSAVAREVEGTGLGMPLTKCLIELHGGRIELESEFGRGTAVTAYLPHERFQFGTLRAVAAA